VKYLVIANPQSGNLRRGARVLARIQKRVISNGDDLNILVTGHKGHAEYLACTYDFIRYDGLLIFGGDGTIHEVVNGMLSRKDGLKLPLGCIPSGTGNSLMRDFGFRDANDVIRNILSGARRSLDVLKIEMDGTCRYGINLVGCGLPALVNEYAERIRVFGSLRYNLASLLAIVTYKPFGLTFRSDELGGGLSSDFILGSNTAHIGSGLKVSPDACTNDGLLDLFALQPTSRWGLIKLFGQLIKGTHLSGPRVHYVKTKNFGVEAGKSGATVNIDGENYRFSRMKVSVLPKEIDLLV